MLVFYGANMEGFSILALRKGQKIGPQVGVPAIELQLAPDVIPMGINRCCADPETGRNLLGGQPLADQIRNLDFGGREVLAGDGRRRQKGLVNSSRP